jgi:hypothetical protein
MFCVKCTFITVCAFRDDSRKVTSMLESLNWRATELTLIKLILKFLATLPVSLTLFIGDSQKLTFTKWKSKTNKKLKYQNYYTICTFANVLFFFKGPWSDKMWELPTHVFRVRSRIVGHNNMDVSISPTCITVNFIQTFSNYPTKFVILAYNNAISLHFMMNILSELGNHFA